MGKLSKFTAAHFNLYCCCCFLLLIIIIPQCLTTAADKSREDNNKKPSAKTHTDPRVSKPLVWIPWNGRGSQPLPIPRPVPDRDAGRGGGGGGGGGRGRRSGGRGGGGRDECVCNCRCDCQTTECNAGGGSRWGGGGRPGGGGDNGGHNGAAICLPLPVNCQGNNRCYFGNGMSFDISNPFNVSHFEAQNNEKGEFRFQANDQEFTSQVLNITNPTTPHH